MTPGAPYPMWLSVIFDRLIRTATTREQMDAAVLTCWRLDKIYQQHNRQLQEQA